MVVQRLACVQIKLLISRNSRIAGTFLAVLLLFGEVSAQIHPTVNIDSPLAAGDLKLKVSGEIQLRCGDLTRWKSACQYF